VVGSLLLEQTTSEILSIQNLALQRLLLITLALFSFTSLVLLSFASLLSTRIRRLRNRLESVVSHDGRIVGRLEAARSSDEIGDLQRSFTRVLDRLRAYNQYLEGMASRLAHELRTPLSIVRTSLDNADQHGTSGEAVYLQRAREGAERLESIIQRLREASRLEQALQHADFAAIDLGELLARQIGGFESIHPGVKIEYRRPATPVRIRLAPDLICQALEKLLSNAVDFHEEGSALRIELSDSNSEVVLTTINRGPPMPREIDPFQSMTSLRDGNDGQPHLGLGLYLVSLIAAFHGGSVAAENRPGGEVAISLRLPLQAAGST
jgi:signal transduction histidine kinase